MVHVASRLRGMVSEGSGQPQDEKAEDPLPFLKEKTIEEVFSYVND